MLLSFGFDGLNDREWEQALSKERNALIYLSEHRRRSAAAGVFDWPVPQQGLTTLDRFYKQAKDWPLALPVAFPGFHDIYAEAKVHAGYGRLAGDYGRPSSRRSNGP